MQLLGFTILPTCTYHMMRAALWLTAVDEASANGYARGYADGWEQAGDLIKVQPEGPELHMAVGEAHV